MPKSPKTNATCALFYRERQLAGSEFPVGVRGRSHRGGSGQDFGLFFAPYALPFMFQLRAPGAGQPEDAALVSPLVFGENDAAVTIAGAGAGEGYAKEQPVRPLARAGASDRNRGHGDITGGEGRLLGR